MFCIRKQYPVSCFALATLKQFDGQNILNHVQDCNETQVPLNSVGILEVGIRQATAWVIAKPPQLIIDNRQVLCILCTSAISFLDPLKKLRYDVPINFTFAQDEKTINHDLIFNHYSGFLIYSPANVISSEIEIDPITDKSVPLLHSIALFGIYKKDNNDTATPLTVNIAPLLINDAEDLSLIGYPETYNYQDMIVPEYDRLDISCYNIFMAFNRFKSIVSSPGSSIGQNQNVIAISNPATPRMSGGPLIQNNKVIGILIGGPPLDDHVNSMKIAFLAKNNLAEAIDLIEETDLNSFYCTKKSDSLATEPNRSEIINDIRSDSNYIFKNAYNEYFSSNPNRPRYNIALASSSRAFKSAIAISRIIEKLDKEFPSINSFFEVLIEQSKFKLFKHSLGYTYLTTEITEEIDDCLNPFITESEKRSKFRGNSIG